MQSIKRWNSLLSGLHRRSIRFASDNAVARSRIDRINSKLPRFLQRFTLPLRDAPVSHVTSFLILHELTAIAPLFAFAGIFHFYAWVPPFVMEWSWVSDGTKKFDSYFRKKGWLADDSAQVVVDGSGNERMERTQSSTSWSGGESTTRLVLEFATAYALTKALLPVRLAFCVWSTPWFARRLVMPLGGAFRAVFRSSK